MDVLSPDFAHGSQSSSLVENARNKAVELEGVFLNTLVSQMFSGLDAKNGFGGGFGEETWRSMQSEQYANLMAQSGGIGLADQIMRELLAGQEVAGQAKPQQIPAGAYGS